MTTFINELLDGVNLDDFFMEDEDVLAVNAVWSEIDFDLDDETDDPANGVALNVYWILDGADTLSDAAELARAYASYLDGLASDGYILAESIENGLGHAMLLSDNI